LTHIGPNGERPYQRALLAGYPVAGDLTFGGLFSESILSGSNLSPEDVLQIWQSDAGDIKTLTSPDFKDVGVGIAHEGGFIYYVLDAGTGSGVVEGGEPPDGQTAVSGTLEAIVVTATALEDGTVYHTVLPGEALWNIALAYGVTVEEIRKNNHLSSDSIFEGQKLLISGPPMETPSPQPSITATLGIPTSTATVFTLPTASPTRTPLPVHQEPQSKGLQIVGWIVSLALLAAGMGAWFGRKS